MYDTIIIGTGPAGMECAITLKIRNKNILVLGNENLSTKVKKAQDIKNYLGFPQISGEDLAKKMEDHAKSLGIDFNYSQVITVYEMPNHFTVNTKNNEYIDAKTVVLATGVSQVKKYEGEEKYLGMGVSYCATCDGLLYKDKKVVVIGESKEEEDEVKYLTSICKEVIYIPLYQTDVSIANVLVIKDTPLAIKGDFKATTLVLKNQEIDFDGLFILRSSVATTELVPGLEMDGNHVLVNRKMETNIKGLFACGAIVGAPYQYIKAAGEGNVAAISVCQYLAKKGNE